jgi:hypothetical protein
MLQITLVIEDKISLDELQEEIAEIEDYVQSTDVAGESLGLTCKALLMSYSSHAETIRVWSIYDFERNATLDSVHTLHLRDLISDRPQPCI